MADEYVPWWVPQDHPVRKADEPPVRVSEAPKAPAPAKKP